MCCFLRLYHSLLFHASMSAFLFPPPNLKSTRMQSPHFPSWESMQKSDSCISMHLAIGSTACLWRNAKDIQNENDHMGRLFFSEDYSEIILLMSDVEYESSCSQLTACGSVPMHVGKGCMDFKCIMKPLFRHLEAGMVAAQGRWKTVMLL